MPHAGESYPCTAAAAFSTASTQRWSNRPARLWIVGVWVLRWRLMVKRGPWVRPPASKSAARAAFAALDVSVKEPTSALLDDTSRVVLRGELKVASEPEALLPVLTNPIYRFKRIGIEAGPLSQWLFSALGEAGLPAIVERGTCRRCCRRDQQGRPQRCVTPAQMMRAGLYRPVHVEDAAQ